MDQHRSGMARRKEPRCERPLHRRKVRTCHRWNPTGRSSTGSRCIHSWYAVGLPLFGHCGAGTRTGHVSLTFGVGFAYKPGYIRAPNIDCVRSSDKRGQAYDRWSGERHHIQTMAELGRRPYPPMKEADSDTRHGMLPEHTYERLRDLIVRGRIPPGARVREAETALRFGVSRTPVREALLRLLHERYLIPASAGRRTELIAAPFNSSDIRELWGIIGALESVAVAVVASFAKPQRTALAADLQQLNSELMKAAATRPRNPDRLFELQSAFHFRFVEEGSGPHLRTIYESLRPQVQRYEWIYGTRADAEYEPSTAEHIRIIAAIRDGEVELARIAVIAHWDKAAKRTARVIDSVGAKLVR